MNIKIGLIGRDTSHVISFAESFKTQQVPGAETLEIVRVIVAAN